MKLLILCCLARHITTKLSERYYCITQKYNDKIINHYAFGRNIAINHYFSTDRSIHYQLPVNKDPGYLQN
jgi:hypothetical protein